MFHGAWPALITPATTEEALSLAALHDLVEYLLAKKVDGLYLCGSTGEGILLSVAERRTVTEKVMAQVGDRVPIIVHVGSMSTRDSVTLARHAQEVGAAGVSSVLPLVNSGLEATYAHYEAIAAAVPDLPFLPYLFGGQVDAMTLMQGLLDRIPNVAGAKYTGPNMYEMGRVIELGHDKRDMGWTIFSGMDEQSVFGRMVGTPGNIGSTLNVMPGIYRQIGECYQAGNLAQAVALQKRANRVTTVLIEHGFSGALREAIRMLGIDCGPPRLPHLPLVAEKQEQLQAKLEQVDFMEVAAL